MKLIFIYILINLLRCIHGANILAIQMVPTKSYSIIMGSIIKNLVPKHNITYYSIVDKVFDSPNVTLIPIQQPIHNYMEQVNIFTKMLNQDDTSKDAENSLMSLTENYIKHMLKLDKFQNLLQQNMKFDLVIMCYSITEYFIPIVHHFGAPLIQISTSTPFPWQNDVIENPNFLSYDNTLFTPEMPDGFINRLIKFIKHVRVINRYKYYYLPFVNEVSLKFYPENTPSIESIIQNTSLLFVNTVEAMGYSRPTVSNYVEIGGIHCNPTKSLPKEIEQFMEDSGEHGVIYFSLGSTFQAQIPDYIMKSFINVFKKLPQRVIWKVTSDIQNLPDNIKALKWCPQQDILGHNKTKVFITQGGMLSLQETVYHGVPVLVIPIAFDQPINAKTVEKLGYGRYLPLKNFAEDILYSELQEILTNSKYGKKVKELSSHMKDVQLTPAEKVKWWVDYIIRYKGFPIYRPKDNRYSWTRNVEIDIFIFILLCVLILLAVVINVLYALFTYISKSVVCIKKIKIN